MGSKTQSIAPFRYAFHGTEPHNIPSILENGMLPEKRRDGGDWFATAEPYTSIGHSRPLPHPGYSYVYKILLFLLLPVAPAVLDGMPYYAGQGIVMSDHHFELPLATITFGVKQ
jgi:hypothetical protein